MTIINEGTLTGRLRRFVAQIEVFIIILSWETLSVFNYFSLIILKTTTNNNKIN